MRYAVVTVGTEHVVYVESADAQDFQTRIQNAVAKAIADGFPNMSSMDLGGGGDGHTFVARLGFITADTIGSVYDITIRCYLAADALALATARANALVGIAPDQDKVDEPIAGASQGTRFMSVILLGTRHTIG